MSNEKPKIKWKLKKVKVEDLKELPENPRFMKDEMMENLKQSIIEDGIIDKPYINTDMTIIGGHQRKKAFLDLGITEVECWFPERLLNEAEVRRINLRGNKIEGEFDREMLMELFDQEELLNSGFTMEELEVADWSSDLDPKVDEDKDNSLKDTIKIECDPSDKEAVLDIIKPALKDMDVKIN